MWRGLVAADGSATARIAVAGGSERDHQHPASGLAAHQPVRRGLGRVEQRTAAPHVINVVDPKVWMLEQVRGLRVDLERVLVVEQIRIESLARHCLSVLQTNAEFTSSSSAAGIGGRRRNNGTVVSNEDDLDERTITGPVAAGLDVVRRVRVEDPLTGRKFGLSMSMSTDAGSDSLSDGFSVDSDAQGEAVCSGTLANGL